jgi:VCBS repeat-containing protein
VVTDSSVVLPPAVLPTVGSATVNAHTINTGTVSNIPANDFSNLQCCAANVSVGNLAAFTGGKNPQTYTYVEQSDIDSATSQLSSTLSQSAQTGVVGQILPGERLIGPINCVPDVTSNHLAGDIAAKVTVTVTETCSGEVYDQLQAYTKAEELLRADAMKSPGANYALLGDIITTITQTVLVNKTGKISLLVKAGGVWVYQFSDIQKRQLAQRIVGKSENDAVAVLAAANGVRSVNVQVNGGDGNTLPGDTRHIIVVVKS